VTITRRGFLAVLAGAAVTLSLGPPRRRPAPVPEPAEVYRTTITLAKTDDGWRVVERSDEEIERDLWPTGQVFRLPASVGVAHEGGTAHLKDVPVAMARHADAAWRVFGMVWLASRGERHWLVVRPNPAPTNHLIAYRACAEHANTAAGCGLLEVGGIEIEATT
jgi:hypothetical protein